MVDLSKLDPATMARHKGQIGRALSDCVAR